MDNFFQGLTWYKTEECILCNDGYIVIENEDLVGDHRESCPCCNGKGFLYIS